MPAISKKKTLVSWWNATRLGKGEGAKYGPLTNMLVDHAFRTGRRLMTGVTRGRLNDADEVGQQSFVDQVTAITKGYRVLEGGPIQDRGTIDIWIVWDEGAVTIEIDTSHRVTMYTATFDNDIHVELAILVGEHLVPDEARKPVYALAEGGVVEVGSMTGVPFEPDNYTDEVVDEFEPIAYQLGKESPDGRLLLLQGPPGTGKSFLIRAFMHAVENAAFLMIPAHLVEHLAGPLLIPTLVDARQKIGPNIPLILIVEDADRCLISRDKEGADLSALSAVLNASDGLLGHALDIRIVCTTNADMADLDEAILRDMRLIADLYVGPLPPEKAAAVYKRLAHEEIEVAEVHTLAECYRAVAEGGFYEEGEESEDGELDEGTSEATF